ncbi:hypothetical protein B0J18DRAFT_71245 [Chaetomium sp. MPI-SDFR-AT-0129]|nr:hypothetical protein B0J18DRAFT_71245 [Chaetomium sp. MPI-SDFR-AT-0129]
MVDLTPPAEDQNNKVVVDPSPAAADTTSQTSPNNSMEDPRAVVETHLWRDVRQYLKRQARPNSLLANEPAIIATCPICLVAELDIAGLPDPGTTSVPNPLATASGDRFAPMAVSSPAAVLVCGHMCCRECIHTWISTCVVDRHQPLACPVCRASLKFTDCEHSIAPYHLASHEEFASSGAQPDDGEHLGLSLARSVEPTLTEGAEAPQGCRPCLMDMLRPWLAAVVQGVEDLQDVDEAGRAACLERLRNQEDIYASMVKRIGAFAWGDQWTP